MFLLLFIFLVSCSAIACASSKSDKFTILRQEMVRTQIANRGIKDKRVLDAFLKVPRHLFVPKEYIEEAYCDYPLPIGEGQTISQPYIVALMSELASLKGTERVLEIGTGSGYQAAILSLLAKEVYTIELIETLAQTAQKRLKDLGYHNVYVRCGDGFLGWSEAQPFDAIIITCALPEIPDSLFTQLKEGGRIVAPIGNEYSYQVLTVFEKKEGKLKKTEYEPVRFVPMRGLIENH
jgi:protein-L-isoaspartate(D-aspartate) O-methyltransferase